MTRPRISWSDLSGKKVGIYGFGVEGQASLRACLARGIEPVLVDDRPSKGPTRTEGNAQEGGPSESGAAVLATDSGGLDALKSCDVVIKSPGISRYGPAITTLQDAGVALVGGLGLWLAEADLDRVLVITGTKGKSTTTAIAGHLLRGLGHSVAIGGNIGVPPYDPEIPQAAREADYWVVEVSSYQATDLPVTPPVAALTSLNPDHLPWHRGDVETYYRDKLSALNQPGARVTIANGDSPLIAAHADHLAPEIRWVRADDDPGAAWIDALGLIGPHNRRNALIAAAALAAMGIEMYDAPLAQAAAGFAGLPSRLQVVHRRGEVLFVDDGLSTNVLGTLAAVESFHDRRVALLVGGQSRGIDYRPLGLGLRGRELPLLLVTMPTNGRDIGAAVAEALAGPSPAADSAGEVGTRPDGADAGEVGAVRVGADAGRVSADVRPIGTDGSPVRIVDAESLADAVRIAAEWAAPDGVVLLSPAAPSFDLYADYRDRGAAFAAAARALS